MKIDYTMAYDQAKTFCALSLNVFIGDWLDQNDEHSPYYDPMKKALAITAEICKREIASTVEEHQLIIKELVNCCELYCEVTAETRSNHASLPFKAFLYELTQSREKTPQEQSLEEYKLNHAKTCETGLRLQL